MCSGPQGVWVNQRVPEAPRGTLLAESASHPRSSGPQGQEPSSAVGSPGDPAQRPYGPALPLCSRCLGASHSLPGKSKHWPVLHNSQKVSGLSPRLWKMTPLVGNTTLPAPSSRPDHPLRCLPLFLPAAGGIWFLLISLLLLHHLRDGFLNDSGWPGPLMVAPAVPGLLCHSPSCSGWSWPQTGSSGRNDEVSVIPCASVSPTLA